MQLTIRLQADNILFAHALESYIRVAVQLSK